MKAGRVLLSRTGLRGSRSTLRALSTRTVARSRLRATRDMSTRLEKPKPAPPVKPEPPPPPPPEVPILFGGTPGAVVMAVMIVGLFASTRYYEQRADELERDAERRRDAALRDRQRAADALAATPEGRDLEAKRRRAAAAFRLKQLAYWQDQARARVPGAEDRVTKLEAEVCALEAKAGGPVRSTADLPTA